MSDKLPDLIDPIYFVNHHKHIQAQVNQQKFPRLQALMAEHEVEDAVGARPVEVEVRFYYDRQLKFPVIEMKVSTVLRLTCQRSLALFDLPIASEVKGVFTESMALTEDLSSEIEVYELGEEGERISLYALIEDEIMLSIPYAPIDPDSQLDWQDEPLPTEPLSAEAEVVAADNPFAALAALKDKKKEP